MKLEDDKWCFGLHLLDATEVENCFVEDIMPDCPASQNSQKFADHFVNNYVTSESKFPPDMWAGIPSEDKRTNNGTESFHTHSNEQFYTSHPAVFIVTDILKKSGYNSREIDKPWQ